MKLLFLALAVAIKGEWNPHMLALPVSNNATMTDLEVLPLGWVLPLIQDTCDSSQLFLEISYSSTTALSIYVYPPFMQTRCDFMSMYYTALGPPAIPDSKNLTAWFISDIMTGLTCFGFQNVDAENTAIVDINATLSCNEFVESEAVLENYAWDVNNNRWIPGWYFSKPVPGSLPDIPLSSTTASSTGSSSDSSSSGLTISAAQKINPIWVRLVMLAVLITNYLMY
jgi:hypothetical protein